MNTPLAGARQGGTRWPGPRAGLVAGLAVALAFGVLWPVARAARPLLPTDDLYTHLSVARHLLAGNGFRCDVAYPLSFAWPFARSLPQPLVHRPPAWPVVLTIPVALAGDDPARAPGAVRGLQVVVLAGLAGLGSGAWVRRQRPGAAVAWLAPLAACPLLPYAVDWGHTELAAGAILLASWLRHRDGARAPGPADGLATGALLLLRPELAWLPLAWWAWLRRGDSADDRPTLGARSARRGLLLALAIAVALAGPWAVRNARLAGNPFFSVQAAAELAKDTRAFPGYDVYRQLEPQPAPRALRDYPQAVARKTARGLRFYGREFPTLMPWAAPALLALGAAAGARRNRREHGSSAGRSGGTSFLREPAAAALLAAVALAVLYAPLDHSLRHLLVIVPVLAWEAGPWLGEWPWSLLPARSSGWRRRAWPAAVAAALPALALVLLTFREPAGWSGAAREAGAAGAGTLAEAARLRALPPGEVAFTEAAAAAWLSGRAAVWSPLDAQVAARIREWLAPGAAGKAPQ